MATKRSWDRRRVIEIFNASLDGLSREGAGLIGVFLVTGKSRRRLYHLMCNCQAILSDIMVSSCYI